MQKRNGRGKRQWVGEGQEEGAVAGRFLGERASLLVTGSGGSSPEHADLVDSLLTVYIAAIDRGDRSWRRTCSRHTSLSFSFPRFLASLAILHSEGERKREMEREIAR